jgi:uncharacterized membrane protein YphA (DoxX/SURF4 family)
VSHLEREVDDQPSTGQRPAAGGPPARIEEFWRASTATPSQPSGPALQRLSSENVDTATDALNPALPTPKGSSMFTTTAVLTIVLALVFLGAGIPKILGAKTSLQMRDQLQIDARLYRVIGFLEIAAVAGLLVGLVVPVLGAAAAGGLALLMIGAIVTHIRAGEAKGSLPAAVLFLATAAAAVVRILSM